MAKYTFKVPKIRDCLDCPCIITDRSEWGSFCGLWYSVYKEDKEIKWSEDRPQWCLLEEEEKNPMSGITTTSIPTKYEVHIDRKKLRKNAGRRLPDNEF